MISMGYVVERITHLVRRWSNYVGEHIGWFSVNVLPKAKSAQIDQAEPNQS